MAVRDVADPDRRREQALEGERHAAELERAQEELRRAHAVLLQAGTMAHLGAWWIEVSDEESLEANPLRWSDEVFRIFGYEPDEVAVSNALFFAHVHPEDRGRVVEAVRGALAERRPYTIEHRIVLRGGEERVVLERAEARYDASGRLVLVIGAVQDVTDQVRARQALQLSEERARRQLAEIEAIYATAPVGLCVFDRDLRWVRINERIAEINGVPAEEHLGKTPREVVPDVGEQAEAALRKILDTGERLDFEMSGTTAAQPGVRRFWNERWVPIKERDGRVVGISVAAEDITALKHAEEALQEASRRKDEFIATLSHELRNPLAPIRNSAHVLGLADPAGEEASRARRVIMRQAEHLTRLVDDLLDVTRVATGKIELRRSRVDLRELVARAADDFRAMLQDRGVAFRTTSPEAGVWVDADATRVTQVIGNLLHNAAKFTRRSDEVTLSLHAAGTEAEVRVRDTGSGIDPALLPHVFDKFVQGKRTLEMTEGGLGLGLALVKGIAELHGGTVRVESAGIDRGAEFIVRLPLATALAARGEDAPARRAVRGRRVLVVDDNVDGAQSLGDLIGILGHHADVANDGPSAIEKARVDPPDLVLCDIGLPGMSGYEVAKALRGGRSGGGMRLIALSGYARPEDVRKALEAGFDGHVAKPCDREDIERLLS